MSKQVAQSGKLTESSIKNAVVFKMILISFIHIIDTERIITYKCRKYITINAEFISAAVTLELRSAQQLIDKTLQDFSQDFYEVCLKWIMTCFKRQIEFKIYESRSL